MIDKHHWKFPMKDAYDAYHTSVRGMTCEAPEEKDGEGDDAEYPDRQGGNPYMDRAGVATPPD